MEGLRQDHERLVQRTSLAKSVDDVQSTIDLLVRARDSIGNDPKATAVTLAKLQDPVRQSFDKVNTDLKEIHAGLGKFQRALDKSFRAMPLPTSSYDALSSHPDLIDRAIAMHLLREGKITVSSTFMTEVAEKASRTASTPSAETSSNLRKPGLDINSVASEVLQKQFSDMYYILSELRNNRNLVPAIEWARSQSEVLEARGSNLEFELSRLKYVWLFSGGDAEKTDTESSRIYRAMAYARKELTRFQGRYLREIKQLCGALAFEPNLRQSPYRRIFHNDSAWEEVANAFTREFCSLLGLSAESPLYLATTAGAIALPTLVKLASIMKEKRTEWTTQNELPVEIPLPPNYHFHSIFVCPVSKEQSTDQNPPMMMPCNHVIAQESLSRISKGTRFKCPYCPGESHPKDAKKVYL